LWERVRERDILISESFFEMLLKYYKLALKAG
jgi:hypothetical protein